MPRRSAKTLANFVSASILPAEVRQALSDFRERVRDIENAFQGSPLSSDAREIGWYLDKLDEMGRIKSEDEIVKKRIEKPGWNPFSHLLKDEMLDQRAIKEIRLERFRSETARKNTNLRGALENIGANGCLLPTQELVAAEALLDLSATSAPTILAGIPDDTKLEVRYPEGNVEKVDEPSQRVEEDSNLVGAKQKQRIEKLLTPPDVAYAIAIAKGEALAPDHWVMKITSPGRAGRRPKMQNVVFLIWLNSTEDKDRSFCNFGAFADRYHVPLPQEYGDLKSFQKWKDACDKRDAELRRWFGDANNYAEKQGIRFGRRLDW